MSENLKDYIQDPSELEPDYELWWKQDNLSEKDIFLLSINHNPSLYKKYNTFRSKDEIMKDKIGSHIYNNYASTLVQEDRIIREIDILKQVFRWDGTKKGIIDLHYLYQFNIPQPHGYTNFHIKEFKKYLLKNKLLPTKYDHYIDKDYSYNYKNIKTAEDINKDEAIGLLLELEPSYLKKYIEIGSKYNGRDDYIYSLAPEDIFFIREYQKQVDNIYDKGIGYIGTYNILERFEFANFTKFVNLAYNDGLIFNEKVEIQLEKLGIELKYDESSWLIKKYNFWKDDKQLCSYIEGLNLYKGLFDKENIIDLRDSKNELIYSGNIEILSYYQSPHDKKETLTLTEYFENSIKSGKIILKAHRAKGEDKYKIKELFEAFLILFPKFKPNDALLEVFELEEATNEQTTSQPIEYEPSADKPRFNTYPKGNLIHKCLAEAVEHYFREKGELPTQHNSWLRMLKMHNENTYSENNSDTINKIKDDTIYWKKKDGVETDVKIKALKQYAKDKILPFYKDQLDAKNPK